MAKEGSRLRPLSASRRPALFRQLVLAAVATFLVATVAGLASCAAPPVGTAAYTTQAGSATSTAGRSTTTRQGPGSEPATSAPSSRPSAAPLARSVPVRLQIAAIGVSSALMDLGLKGDGTMEVPPGAFPAGWYTGSPTPGELGPAIIAGHIDWNGPGVFLNLSKLRPGDQVTVTRKDGSKPVFAVTRVERFSKAEFPTKQVYGNIDRAGLRLITCGGAFNSGTGHYEDNIVAFADLVAPAR